MRKGVCVRAYIGEYYLSNMTSLSPLFGLITKEKL